MPQRTFRTLACVFLASTLGATGCAENKHFTLFGYTTAPMHDTSIRTVYVPIFQNATYQRDLEFTLTRLLVEEIESKTPYKVVPRREMADAEILGKIVNVKKNTVNFTQLAEIRDAERVVGVEIIYRDVRTGKQLGIPDSLKPRDLRDVDPNAKIAPVVLEPRMNYIPEIGGSVATADYLLARRLAVQIVSMMETWNPQVKGQ